MNVTGTTAGAKNNTTGAVTSTEGGTGGIASASLAVRRRRRRSPRPSVAELVVNGTTTLTFTLANPNAGTALNGVGFTDALPAGLVVAPRTVTGTCGGTLTTAAGTTIGSAREPRVARGPCMFSIKVPAAATATQVNTTSAVTSANGGGGNAATASITAGDGPNGAGPHAVAVRAGRLAIMVMLIGLRRIFAK